MSDTVKQRRLNNFVKYYIWIVLKNAKNVNV